MGFSYARFSLSLTVLVETEDHDAFHVGMKTGPRDVVEGHRMQRWAREERKNKRPRSMSRHGIVNFVADELYIAMVDQKI